MVSEMMLKMVLMVTLCLSAEGAETGVSPERPPAETWGRPDPRAREGAHLQLAFCP